MESAIEPRKCTHFFYHMTKHVSSESSHPPNIPLFYVGQLLFAIYSTIRLSLLSYMSNQPSPPLWYFPYDAAAYAIAHPSAHLDSSLPLNILVLEFFLLYGNFLIYRQPATSYSIRWFEDIVVQFQDKSREALLSLTERNRVLKEAVDSWNCYLVEKFHGIVPLFGRGFIQQCTKPIARLCAKTQIWVTLGNYNRQRLYRAPLSVQPNLSSTIRRRLLLSLQAVERFSLAAQVLNNYSTHQFFLITYLRCREGLAWTALPSALSDLLLFYYLFYNLIDLAFFFTFCTLFSVLVNMGHCRDICRQLCIVLLKDRRQNTRFRRSSSKAQLARQFTLFFIDYYRCIGLATYGNGQLFSRVLFAFFLTNVPVNIYFITQIVFNSKNISMFVMSIIICAFQAVALYAVLGPLAFFCAEMHRPTKILPIVQFQLGPNYPLLKLKLDNLHFRLLTHAPVTISVGPLNAVTHSFILEFLAMYAGYLLMAFSMQMKL